MKTDNENPLYSIFSLFTEYGIQKNNPPETL